MTIDVPCPLWVISDGRADDVRFVPKADSCTAAKRYSISSLAVASSCGSILRPSDLAVLRLTTNMNLLGCTDIDLAKRKAAKLAALKLVWRARLEVLLFVVDQNRTALRNCCPESKKRTRTRYRCFIIWDNSVTVGSLPFGVNVLMITGIPCDSVLVS